MKRKIQILDNIVAWSKNIPEIKAIILEGSMGSGDEKDEYTDYDINLFVTSTKPFVENDKWFEQFDEIVVFQKEGVFYRNSYIPTRLIIYQNSPRVDFSFWPISIIENWITEQELPEFYKNGYKVLLDKLGITDKLLPPTNNGYMQKRPARNEFVQNIFNFFFEASIIAKYLYRNNLWFANKLSNGPLKDFLQQMIMWQTAEKKNWELKGMNSLGKNLEEKIADDVTSELSKCFSVHEIDSCWKSLFSMIELFYKIAVDLSKNIKINFPDNKIETIMNYIYEIKRKSDDNIHFKCK